MMSRKIKLLIVFLLFGLSLFGCTGEKNAEMAEKDKVISEISVPGLLEHCVDEAGQYVYYTVNAESVIYQSTIDGTVVGQFAVTADDAEPDKQGFIGEKPPEAVNLCGLCMSGNTLYCFRPLKKTLMAINVETGENRLVDKFDIIGINKMAAGTTSVLIMTNVNTENVLYAYHVDTGNMELVLVENPVMITHAEADTYWLNVTDDTGAYYFQKYHADTRNLSEKYKSNFTYELSELAYNKENRMLYGKFSEQYVCFNPEQPNAASRFTAQDIYTSPAYLQVSNGNLFIQDQEKGIVYYLDPTEFMMQNMPLKGYVTSEFVIEDWAGYNIDLEVIDWEELALKVLAADRDYDFVVMNTTMAEAVALRDAMAYLTIPEETVANYWAECWPCVREGASHNGDIWMLPLEIYARGLVYSEQNLAKYGLSMENIKTMPKLCEAAKVLHGGGEAGWYNLQPMQNHLLQEYVWKQQDAATMNFDTPEFRSIMEFIREEYKNNDYSPAYYRNSYININSSGMEYDSDSALTYDEQLRLHYQRQAANIYFDETSDYDAYSYTKYAGAEGLRVRTVPGMFGTEETAQINGTFLVLNPNSENREELLDFVSAMSEAYIANPETWLSSNQERYATDLVTQDVCSLYRNGEMVFGMPEGLFTSYYQYIMGSGELSADEVVKELNRVVNMYYGE